MANDSHSPQGRRMVTPEAERLHGASAEGAADKRIN